jgi:hypothetical protein
LQQWDLALLDGNTWTEEKFANTINGRADMLFVDKNEQMNRDKDAFDLNR